jgi:hypothetical protein
LFADSQVRAKQGSDFRFAARRPAAPIFCRRCRLLLDSGGVLRQLSLSFFVQFSILQLASRLSFLFGSEAQCRSGFGLPIASVVTGCAAGPFVLVCAKPRLFSADMTPGACFYGGFFVSYKRLWIKYL